MKTNKLDETEQQLGFSGFGMTGLLGSEKRQAEGDDEDEMRECVNQAYP
jgi:hypothetical protein